MEVTMRFAIFCIAVAMLVADCSHAGAQQAKQEKTTPLPIEAKSRFSPELIELLTATSGGYELNGTLIPPAMHISTILKATKSKDPRIQELGCLSCDLVYLFARSREQTPDPEIERIAKANMPAGVNVECLKIISDRVPAEQLAMLSVHTLIKKLLEEGGKRGDIADLHESPLMQQFANELDKQRKKSRKSSISLIVGQNKGLESKGKTIALVGQPATVPPTVPEPIRVRLETTQEQQVVVAVTNQTTAPLHHCMLFARAIPDPKLVEKTFLSQLSLLRIGEEFGLRDSDDPVDVAELELLLQVAELDLLLQFVLNNMERGSMVFVPEIPAGATARIGLISADHMVYLKDSEFSLWCEELTVASLKTGTRAGFPPALSGERLSLSDKPTSVKTELTRSGPRDPQVPPEMLAKVCKVYQASMAVGKTYIIEVKAEESTSSLNKPPVLRVEDEIGQVQSSTREKTLANRERIAFTPTADGSYRIICTESFGGPGKFTLTIYTKVATDSRKVPDKKNKDHLTITVSDVDYIYQGTTRNGGLMYLTLLAISRDGIRQAPQGKMVLVDEEGNQYEGYPIAGFGVPPQLREGVPLKLVWIFGNRSAFDIAPRPVPSARIKQFASVTVELGPGGGETGIEIRDVPAIVARPRKK
jgi:hypothetical protein